MFTDRLSSATQSCLYDVAGPNPAVDTDAHRRGFARAGVAGYLTR